MRNHWLRGARNLQLLGRSSPIRDGELTSALPETTAPRILHVPLVAPVKRLPKLLAASRLVPRAACSRATPELAHLQPAQNSLHEPLRVAAQHPFHSDKTCRSRRKGGRERAV